MIKCDTCKYHNVCEHYCDGTIYTPSIYLVFKRKIRLWLLKKLGDTYKDA